MCLSRDDFSQDGRNRKSFNEDIGMEPPQPLPLLSLHYTDDRKECVRLSSDAGRSE